MLNSYGMGYSEEDHTRKNAKFIEGAFQRLWTRLAEMIRMERAWHARTDGQSERMNQY
jgi:hypothetical protein